MVVFDISPTEAVQPDTSSSYFGSSHEALKKNLADVGLSEFLTT